MTDMGEFISQFTSAKSTCDSLKRELCRHLNISPENLEVSVSAKHDETSRQEPFTLVVGDFSHGFTVKGNLYNPAVRTETRTGTYFTEPTAQSSATRIAKYLSEKPETGIRWDRPLASTETPSDISTLSNPGNPYKAKFDSYEEFMRAVQNAFPPPLPPKDPKKMVAEAAIDPATGRITTTSRRR